jgi:hypothetical protein
VGQLITDNGGELAGSVTARVTHVIAKDIGSAKTKTAAAKGER